MTDDAVLRTIIEEACERHKRMVACYASACEKVEALQPAALAVFSQKKNLKSVRPYLEALYDRAKAMEARETHYWQLFSQCDAFIVAQFDRLELAQKKGV